MKNHSCNLSRLQALVDGELSSQHLQEVIAHLLDCSNCRSQWERIQSMSNFAESHLQAAGSSVDHAWERMQQRLAQEPISLAWERFEQEKGEIIMTTPTIANVPQPQVSTDLVATPRRTSNRWQKKFLAFTSAAVVVAITLGTSWTDWGQKAFASMLQTFHMQHLAGVSETDIAKIREQLQQAEGTEIDLQQFGKIVNKGGGQTRNVSLDQARQLTGQPVKALPGANGTTEALYQAPQELVFDLNVDRLNRLLQQLGSHSLFPASLNGQQMILQVPAVVKLSTQTADGKEMKLEQFQSPRLQVADHVNSNEVRQALLHFPLLPDEMRNQLAGTWDWKQTLLVRTGPGEVKSLSLKGHEAVLNSNPDKRSIVWLENNKIYKLYGSEAFPTDEALVAKAEAIAN